MPGSVIRSTNPKLRMRTHQRNLYNYFLRHEQDGCCPVPLHRSFGVQFKIHIHAIQALEDMKLIEVDRPSDNYLTWTMRFTK